MGTINMIFVKPTKYGAGITIYGDLHDFQNLHETIHHITKLSPLIDGRGEFVLGLAYEVRHAYQDDREVLKLSAGLMESETTTYFGFRELWPNFLMQLGLLRWAAGFQPTNKEHHANLFRLEACAERALTDYDPFIGRRCVEWLSHFSGFSDRYLLQYIPNCSLQYVTVGKAGKMRFKTLADILRVLSPLSNEYHAFEAYMQNTAKEKGCRPEDLMDLGEWPVFKW
jgi:uncharacterized protein DUF6904